MGSILHHAGYDSDAIVVLEASLAHLPNFVFNHFIMGHVCGYHGKLHKAEKHYNVSLLIQPDFEDPMRYRHAVACVKRIIQILKTKLPYVFLWSFWFS